MKRSFSVSQITANPARGLPRLALNARAAELLLLAALLVAGFSLRMIRLNNPPFDFHPTRQLRAAIIARGMYYQGLPGADPALREKAVSLWATMERYEPPIFEWLVAQTYHLVGGEHLWVARVYSALFWVIGGEALYALARRALSPGGAVFALAFYLFLPWSVTASRSFQPDPMMVMWILLAVYALYRWSETQASSWRWTLLAAFFSGLAVLVKAVAVFAVGAAALFSILAMLGEGGTPWKNLARLLRRPQLWVYALISVLLASVYYIGLGERSTSFASFWILSYTGLLLDSKFYIRWLALTRGILDNMAFFAALAGACLFAPRGRAAALGLWAGYLLIGLVFPYQIYTHDYYSLLLVPVAALGLAPFADWMFARARQQPRFWRAALSALLLAVLGYYAYVSRSQLVAVDYRNEPVPWQQMGADLPDDGSIVALIHDYGNRLKYYGWRTVARQWPSSGDVDLSTAAGTDKLADFDGLFRSQTQGMDYFLVTLFSDLEAQPQLKAILYDHYPIAQEGDGYVLFDLRHPR